MSIYGGGERCLGKCLALVSCFPELWRLYMVPLRQGCCWMMAEDHTLGCPWDGQLEGQTRGEHHGAELDSWGL